MTPSRRSARTRRSRPCGPSEPIRLAASPGTEPLRLPYQWGLENHGGDCLSEWTIDPCRSDVDIDAAAAWTKATGKGIVVAILDDGLDFSHPDLVGQAWVNDGESGTDERGQSP